MGGERENYVHFMLFCILTTLEHNNCINRGISVPVLITSPLFRPEFISFPVLHCVSYRSATVFKSVIVVVD
jgi:hypothetical protein